MAGEGRARDDGAPGIESIVGTPSPEPPDRSGGADVSDNGPDRCRGESGGGGSAAGEGGGSAADGSAKSRR